MPHQTEVVKTEHTHDDAIAVTVRCCGNPKTDAVLTIYNAHKLTAEQVAAKVDKHHDQVSARHAGVQEMLQHLSTLKTLKKTHEHKG